jgi:hypothetical protein
MVVVLILQTGIKILFAPLTVEIEVAAWFRNESLGFFGRRDMPAQVRQAPDHQLKTKARMVM